MGKKPIVSVTYENERKVTIDARYAWEKIYFFSIKVEIGIFVVE